LAIRLAIEKPTEGQVRQGAESRCSLRDPQHGTASIRNALSLAQCNLVATIVLQRRIHASVVACGKDFEAEVNADCAVADRNDIGKASTDGATLEIVKRYIAELVSISRQAVRMWAQRARIDAVANREKLSPRSVGESIGPASATAIQPTENGAPEVTVLLSLSACEGARSLSRIENLHS
jgi:hypothetical protein